MHGEEVETERLGADGDLLVDGAVPDEAHRLLLEAIAVYGCPPVLGLRLVELAQALHVLENAREHELRHADGAGPGRVRQADAGTE